MSPGLCIEPCGLVVAKFALELVADVVLAQRPNGESDGVAVRMRPGVIVSNDGATTTAQRLGRGVVTVVPVTSNIDHVHPFQTLLPADETGLDVDSKAQAEQVRSVAVERVGSLIGTVRHHPIDRAGYRSPAPLDRRLNRTRDPATLGGGSACVRVCCRRWV